MRVLLMAFALFIFAAMPAAADPIRQTKGSFEDKFRQLDEAWPTPDEKRLASGAPGPEYWQQEVDYAIKVRLDESARRLTGSAAITYKNNSPHTLTYLWLQLDQNRFKAGSMDNLTRTNPDDARIAYYDVRRAERMKAFKGGYDIASVRDARGAAMQYAVVDTNMRVDLPRALKPGETFAFSIEYAYNMIDTNVIGGRAGYECFTRPDQDGNCLFLAAQWFPRLHAYSDYEGWHNKAFLGSGEFTLEFGDYRVEITVPDDHVISSTGVLQNEKAVLTAEQQRRLASARASDKPVFIVTPEEAKANETSAASGSKTWIFAAQNVRDFAWASSRKFIWDGMRVKQNSASGGADVLAMSFYPKEAEPLWSAYSTKSIAHTLKVYSRFSFPYPYPTAQSVNGPVGGMEYPMITFNGPRPEKDKDGNLTYSARNKYGLIGVVIHEIGHIYFPMTVNSDERQWTWMDEGINTFLQFVAEQEWEENFPSRRGEPKNIIDYMVSTDQVPIMTQSDSLLQFGNNSYGKPATALNILRETILGREVFDRAFVEYAQRWKFKRPTPYDFFRSMEEASGTDLDWFWRGWFYSTEHVDIAIDSVTRGTLKSPDADVEAEAKRAKKGEEPLSLTIERNRGTPKAVEEDPSLLDFYNKNDEFSVGADDRKAAKKKQDELEEWEREALNSKSIFYYVTFSNKGGVVMPVILKVKYASGREEIIRIPAEIWRRSPDKVTKMLVVEEQIASIELDPRWETADADRNNNHFPQKIEQTRLELYKQERDKNLMQRLDQKVEPSGLATSPAVKKATGEK